MAKFRVQNFFLVFGRIQAKSPDFGRIRTEGFPKFVPNFARIRANSADFRAISGEFARNSMSMSTTVLK